MRCFLFGVCLLTAISTFGDERRFSFSNTPANQAPEGFRSLVAGQGKPGDWRVISNESRPGAGPEESAVLAQLSREPSKNRVPMLIFEDETYSDFRLTTRFRIVGGALEQTAGVVFRFQNASNYFVVGADAIGKTFRCYKVENGSVKAPIGPEFAVSKDTWHTLTVQCEGTRVLCAIDGQDVIKLIDSGARRTGKVGFFTQSDSLAQFADARITYTPHQRLADALVRDALRDYPRVLDLQIFAIRRAEEGPVVIASKEKSALGRAGGKTESETIRDGNTYFGRTKEAVLVTLPLRDRNGEPIAAVRVTLKAFPGQTEDTSITRAQPIVKSMQTRVQSLDELLE
jgi:hypothetical protein